MKKNELRILCPNGHLGYGMTKENSFNLGVEAKPDFIICDSGSDDIGPTPLGADTSTSPYAWQKHDLELMLIASRKLGIPMIVSSCGDTGANSRVDLFVRIIKELAQKHQIPRFKLGYFYSEVTAEYLRDKLRSGKVIEGLDGRKPLSKEDIKQTSKMVLLAGVHPFLKLLNEGADVIMGGRSGDICPFAAAAIHNGFPEGLAYHLGKLIECASFCAEPYMGKESIMGTITDEDIKLTAMNPDQRCTVASVAGHSMYERSNPFNEFALGGMLDMTNCRYEQSGEKTTRVTGAKFIPSPQPRAKLEGSGKVGERFIGFAGIRDPYSIENVDGIIGWARSQVEEKYGTDGYHLCYHIYGRDGVMGEIEPVKKTLSHELCIVVEGIAPTKEMAEDIAMIGTRQLFYARLPQVKGSAGSAAMLVEEVLPASPSYRWTMNHVVPLDDPLEPFVMHMTEAGI